MGLWRSIHDWTRTLIGCGVLLVITIVVGALADRRHPRVRRSEHAGNRRHQEARGNENRGGKEGREERTARRFHQEDQAERAIFQEGHGPAGRQDHRRVEWQPRSAQRELPADLVAQTPQEVDAHGPDRAAPTAWSAFTTTGFSSSRRSRRRWAQCRQAGVIFITVIEADTGDKIHVTATFSARRRPIFSRPAPIRPPRNRRARSPSSI